MKKIDTNLRKPVIFLNGTKYKLDKAYTFVNGVKQILWGESGVQIDYISSTGVLGGGMLFAIGEDWLDAYRSNTIYRISIANLSNPTLIQSVNWNNVSNFNGFQTTAGNMIFDTYAYAGGNTTSNELQVNPVNGTITVGGNATYTGNYLMFTNNNLTTHKTKTKTFTPSTGTVSLQYGTDFIWNGVVKYSTGREPTSVQDRNFSLKLNGKALQVGTDTIIFNLTGDYGSPGLYSGTPTGYNRITNTNTGTYMYDTDYILVEHSISIELLDKTSYTSVYTYTSDTNNVLKCLGRNGDYYYIIEYPSSSSATSGVKLKLLSKSDLSVAFTRDLPADPFNENSGFTTFWRNCSCIIQNTQTGFLGVGTYNANTLALRVARISGIF